MVYSNIHISLIIMIKIKYFSKTRTAKPKIKIELIKPTPNNKKALSFNKALRANLEFALNPLIRLFNSQFQA